MFIQKYFSNSGAGPSGGGLFSHPKILLVPRHCVCVFELVRGHVLWVLIFLLVLLPSQVGQAGYDRTATWPGTSPYSTGTTGEYRGTTETWTSPESPLRLSDSLSEDLGRSHDWQLEQIAEALSFGFTQIKPAPRSSNAALPQSVTPGRNHTAIHLLPKQVKTRSGGFLVRGQERVQRTEISSC